MVTISKAEMLNRIVESGEVPFRIRFVKATGKEAGQIGEKVCYYGAPNPRPKSAHNARPGAIPPPFGGGAGGGVALTPLLLCENTKRGGKTFKYEKNKILFVENKVFRDETKYRVSLPRYAR